MRVGDVMTRSVETISPTESTAAALTAMKQKRIRHLVVTQGKNILGVVSDRDLESFGSDLRGEAIEAVMTSSVVTATPTMTLRKAANLLRGRTIGCLPVVDDDRLVGIVTTTDLLDLIGHGTERPIDKGKRWVLKGRGPRRKSVAGRKGVPAR